MQLSMIRKICRSKRTVSFRNMYVLGTYFSKRTVNAEAGSVDL